jgi:hypothetical protein
VVPFKKALFMMRPLSLFETVGAPPILRVVESFVDGIESRIHVRAQVGQAGVVNEGPHEYGDRGNTNGKGDLDGLIGHHCLQNTPSALGTRGDIRC